MRELQRVGGKSSPFYEEKTCEQRVLDQLKQENHVDEEAMRVLAFLKGEDE